MPRPEGPRPEDADDRAIGTRIHEPKGTMRPRALAPACAASSGSQLVCGWVSLHHEHTHVEGGGGGIGQESGVLRASSPASWNYKLEA